MGAYRPEHRRQRNALYPAAKPVRRGYRDGGTEAIGAIPEKGLGAIPVGYFTENPKIFHKKRNTRNSGGTKLVICVPQQKGYGLQPDLLIRRDTKKCSLTLEKF